MKIIPKSPEECGAYKSKLTELRYHKENIIKQKNDPLARAMKFKDERKVTEWKSEKSEKSENGEKCYWDLTTIMR